MTEYVFTHPIESYHTTVNLETKTDWTFTFYFFKNCY